MDKNTELLLQQLDIKLKQQTATITTEVTKNVMQALDEKMKSLIEENKTLKTQVTKLENKVNLMERDKRKSNLIFFGIDEKGKNENELVDYIREIVIGAGIALDSQEISNVRRIGTYSEKTRPVVVSFTTIWKKHLLLKNKTSFSSGIYFKEDYPKEVIEIRKQLQPKLEEEKKKGNIAFIKYDKLIVKKPKDSGREKRKRDETQSPKQPSSYLKKSNTTTNSQNRKATPASTKEIIKPNLFNYVSRERSASTSEISKNI